MNVIRKLFAGTVFALAAAIPAAQAQEAQPAGVVDCTVAFATCLATGGGVLGCGVAFAKCLVTGGRADADRREA